MVMSARVTTTEESQTYRTAQAIETYSVYSLFAEERYLFAKYFQPGDRVLDLACGIGRTTLRLHEMGCAVKGIDLSEPFISCARRRFPYLELATGSFTDLGEPAESYDHVLISYNGLDCAHPESERVRALQECHRVLRPGGTLIFSSHNIRALLASPIFLRDLPSFTFKLRHTFTSLKGKAFIFDHWAGAHLFYARSEYVIRQTTELGFEYCEMVGLRASPRWWIAQLASPYLHYAFRKPARPLRA
jgi:SAM-dependent methyltransferase